MARQNFSFEKRQKERARQKKKQDKLEKRQSRTENSGQGDAEIVSPADASQQSANVE